MKKISGEKIAKIYLLLDQGVKTRHIAERLAINQDTVLKYRANREVVDWLRTSITSKPLVNMGGV